LTFDPKN